jgi:hypothetical protein
VELCGRPERVLSPDDDQAVDLVGLQVFRQTLRTAVLLERVGPRRAEDRAAARQYASDLRDPERRAEALERPGPAVAIADELVPVLPHPLANYRADHRVQSGAVASTGEHADPHAINLPGPHNRSAFGDVSAQHRLHVDDWCPVQGFQISDLHPGAVDRVHLDAMDPREVGPTRERVVNTPASGRNRIGCP